MIFLYEKYDVKLAEEPQPFWLCRSGLNLCGKAVVVVVVAKSRTSADHQKIVLLAGRRQGCVPRVDVLFSRWKKKGRREKRRRSG